MTQPGRKDDCGKPNDWVILVKQSSKGMDGVEKSEIEDGRHLELVKAEAYPPRKERRQSSRRKVLPDGCNLEGNYDTQKTSGSHTETSPKTKNLLDQQKKITQTAVEKSMIELYQSGVTGRGVTTGNPGDKEGRRREDGRPRLGDVGGREEVLVIELHQSETQDDEWTTAAKPYH
ncbi:hypothetical protein BC827DRAFT_1159886 [Russula dissimulans]|nr:hypothetical protein BC827DRAFT_1159886 [Russula dissimulans]